MRRLKRRILQTFSTVHFKGIVFEIDYGRAAISPPCLCLSIICFVKHTKTPAGRMIRGIYA